MNYPTYLIRDTIDIVYNNLVRLFCNVNYPDIFHIDLDIVDDNIEIYLDNNNTICIPLYASITWSGSDWNKLVDSETDFSNPDVMVVFVWNCGLTRFEFSASNSEIWLSAYDGLDANAHRIFNYRLSGITPECL